MWPPPAIPCCLREIVLKHEEVILVDSASLGEHASRWIEHVLRDRVAHKGRAHTRMLPSLTEAILALENVTPHLSAVVVAHLRPRDERAPHAYFGQRWGLEPGALLRSMLDEGTRLIHEWLTPTLPPVGDIRSRCTRCAELLLTVPDAADAKWLDRALSFTCTNEIEAWACRDARDARAQAGASTPMRFRDAPEAPEDRCAWMYHAGPRDICMGAPKGVHARALWASPSPAFAACFGMPCVREGRALHGIDLLAPKAAVTVSADRDIILEDLSGTHTAMHRLRVPPGTAIPAGACPRLEFVLDGTIEIAWCDHMSTADAMARWQISIEHPEPHHDGLFAQFGVSDAQWQHHFGCSRIEVERYASLRRSAAAWLSDATGCSPSDVPQFEASRVARLLRRAVLPEIGSSVSYPEGGHGERHACVISHLALLIAVLEEIPPLAPAIAGALHDIGRQDDAPDADHPARGAAVAKLLVPTLRSAALPERACAEVVSAIATHSDDGIASCPVSAVLRDADRLLLAWERGYDSRHFSTGAGRAIANAGPHRAEQLFRERFDQCLFDTVGFTGGIDAEP